MKVLIFLLLLLPSFILSYEVFYLQNVIDPIKYIYSVTGAIALILLFFTTTISLIKSWINLISYRKMIGLFSFYYAFLHFLNFIILDMELDFIFAFEETLDKPFIYLGMISFLILVFMAITSFGKLFKLYFKYHKVIYIALALTTIHFIMAQKALSIPQMGYVGIILIIAYFKFRQRIL
ncbi:MAG: ferric reductase [Arcobacter sp.]|uniref:ferric reductase-like transmembrane domain-containing protein n=1 Tax=uncultured Arcobacter sp. TaxID=165434 RepID=UPI000CB0E885|nr:ferric reductase-like transmembrane domain-containing protein [uncultured Arcobacter sp.]PLY09333.1 MAG: ferric reductase [Arcobacter sp.]